MADATITQPLSGLGSVAETNRLLGGDYFDQSGAQTKAFTPTVVSNANVSEKSIPDNGGKLANLTKGTQNGQQGTFDASGKFTPNSSSSSSTDSTNGQPTSKSSLDEIMAFANGGTAPSDVSILEKDPLLKSEFDLVQGLKATHDAEYNSTVANIKAMYADKLNKLDASQKASTASINQSLAISGSSQYAPISSQGILDAKTKSDMDNMTTLQNEEQDLIAKAQSAKNANDEKTVNDTLALYDKKHQELLDQAKTIQNNLIAEKGKINTIAEDAKKAGADDATVKKILGSGSEADAIDNAGDSLRTATGDFADYPQYKRDALASGLTPLDATAWLAQKKKDDAKQKFSDAYQTEAGKEAASNAGGGYNGSTNKEQVAMEKDFKSTLLKEFSSRSGTYGLNDAKVSQANKLAQLFNQGYDPKTGNYTINKQNYGELAIGVANLVSGSSGASESTIESLKARTAKGDIGALYTYLTGAPASGTSQEILNSMATTIEREAKQAEEDRQTDENKLIGLAPTDLDPARRDALIKAQSIQYIGIKGAAKNQVDAYVKSNPDKADAIAKMYDVPGATDEAVWAYLQNNQ